jgi:hypothetical protein
MSTETQPQQDQFKSPRGMFDRAIKGMRTTTSTLELEMYNGAALIALKSIVASEKVRVGARCLEEYTAAYTQSPAHSTV